jgi:hypothetical protein
MDSIDFSCHEAVFIAIAARKTGGKIAKKQKKHKHNVAEVAT